MCVRHLADIWSEGVMLVEHVPIDAQFKSELKIVPAPAWRGVHVNQVDFGGVVTS